MKVLIKNQKGVIVKELEVDTISDEILRNYPIRYTFEVVK